MVRIVSYNIQKAVGPDLKRSPHRIMEVINDLKGDIVLLQEVDRRLPPRPSAIPHELIEAHSDYDKVDLAENDVSMGWHGNAILVRSGLDVVGIDRIRLPSLEPRGAVLADIAMKGRIITVVGVHLALLRIWRRRQIQAIISTMDQDRKERSIIAGDFNEWSTAHGLGRLARSHTILTPGLTFHASRPIAALDRFAHAPSLTVKAIGVHDTVETRRGSDHLPIWADFEFI